MLRAEKAKVIDGLHAIFSGVSVVVVAHCQGLTVPEATELRRRVRDAGAGFKVTKNRLAKRALDGTSFAGMAPLFTGPTAIGFSRDPIAAPKALTEYARRSDKVTIIGGGLGATLLDAEAVKALAELPSLDALRARLIALITTPASRLVGVIQAPGGQLARLLTAHAEHGGEALSSQG